MRVTKTVLLSLLLCGCHRGGDPQPATAPQPASTRTPDAADSTPSSCGPQRYADVASQALARVGGTGAVVMLDLETGDTLLETGTQLTTPTPPASSVKPFVALAALRAGALAQDEPLACDGTWSRDAKLTCFDEHGAQTLTDALASSCNAFFYEVAARAGAPALAAEFTRVGLTELASAITSAGDDQARLVATAIGHHDARARPPELARAYATMLTDDDPLRAVVTPGLEAAVARGTAQAAAVDGMKVAGKTGTAEAEGDEMYAWFVGYAPAEEPRVLVLVHVVGDGAGGQLAAPIAGELLATWRGCETRDV